MKILIPEIPKDGLDIEVDEAIDVGGVSVPIKARVRIEKLDAEVMASGDLNAELRLQCSRCLKEFDRTLSFPVEAVFHPVDELQKEDKHEISSEELDMDFYSGEEVDIIELLKEQIMLNEGMKPLCDDACKGICSGCGADLNVEGCRCTRTDTDPRLAKLKNLLNQ